MQSITLVTFVFGLSGPLALQPDQLMELWGTALKLPNGRAAALSAAVTLLSSSSSPVAPPVKGVIPERILYPPLTLIGTWDIYIC